MEPLTMVFADNSEVWTVRLMFHRSIAGLGLRADVREPNRLLLEGQPVESLIVRLEGPAAAAFWEVLLPAGRPVRSVDGLTISYHAGEQRLVLLAEAGDGTSVTLADQPVLRAEIQVVGPGAAIIWASMSQQFPVGDKR